MSVLVILIPPRARLAGRDDAAAPRPSEFDHVFSQDGQAVTATGRAPAARLPRADTVLAMVADADVSWHRLTVPKAPAARLRAALGGAMEEALLDDDETLHIALAPGLAAGQSGWVAVLHKPWLAGVLAELDAGGRTVERVVPASAPGGSASGHFFADAADAAHPLLALADADGAAVLGTRGALARALLGADAASRRRFTATPAAAAAAEHWLAAPVAVLTEAERALQAARSTWNLRQFDLAPRHRGTVALRQGLRRLLSPAWRPVRWAVAALVAVNLVGLNAWAWQLQREIGTRRAEMASLLKTTHPGVRAIVDPPLQMRREAERLRASAGRLGDGDLEALLGAAASAWPDGQGPVQTVRFEPGRLTLAAAGWGDAQVSAFRERLRPSGFVVELADGRVTLSRGGAS